MEKGLRWFHQREEAKTAALHVHERDYHGSGKFQVVQTFGGLTPPVASFNKNKYLR